MTPRPLHILALLVCAAGWLALHILDAQPVKAAPAPVEAAQTGVQAQGAIAPLGVLRSAPSLSVAQIDAILAGYGSPAAGSGQAFEDAGIAAGIDPAYALAFFVHESSAGTNPNWAGWKSDGSSTHNVGNIICAGYATCYGRFRDYPDWHTGVADWYRLINDEYIGGRGLTTVEQVIPVYAPSDDNNDVPGYTSAISVLVGQWRKGGMQ